MLADSIGPYRILGKLGAGGMGEVYRARDTQLQRDVALKVLPSDLAPAGDAPAGSGPSGAQLRDDRRARFEREARALATLNHPHIAQVYGVVHDGRPTPGQGSEPASLAQGGVYAIAMELVEGPTLAERIKGGAVPLDEALSIAHQLADALEYAHERGIVHRDLKPANIKLTPDGAVKVLDFGLAKALNAGADAPLSIGPDAANSPTMTSPAMTRAGIILGTAAYMSPEQARGAAVDKRADVWAFGVVLFEMLTGHPCFGGETVTDVLAAVMRADPDWAQLPAATPPAVRELLRRCLTRDRRQRLHDMGDARLELEHAALESPAPPSPAPAPSRLRAGWWRLSPAAAMVVAVAAFIAGWLVMRPAPPAPNKQMRVAVDVGTPDDSIGVMVAGAPDGSGFVYCGVQGGLWRWRWDRLVPEPVPGFEGGCLAAAFSSDGRRLAVIDNPTGLRIVSATDESTRPQSLAVSGLGDFGFGGAIDWASDGNIYIASAGGLIRVSPADGRSALIAKPDPHVGPWVGLDVLPESRSAVTIVAPPSTGPKDWRIGIVDLQKGTLDSLDLAGVAARYVKPGHLLIAHYDGSMAVVPFDLRSLRPTGSGRPLSADRLGIPWQLVQGTIDVTDDGTLLYWASRAGNRSHPVLVDLQGTATPFSAAWTGQTFRSPHLVNDDAMLAVEVVTSANTHVYTLDRRSGRTERLTADGTINRPVFWNPGERLLTVLSDRSGAGALYLRRLDDDGLKALTRYDPRPIWDANWSAGGKWLLLRTDDNAAGKGDILAVRPGLDSAARPIAGSPNHSEYSPALSPDGRWLALVTNETETGRYEVVVKPFPDARGQWQISSPNVGSEPIWSHSGRNLFYISDGYLMAADIAAGPEFRVTARRRLFSVAPYVQFRFGRNIDITLDDQRFLMLQRDENVPSRIVAVFNWASDLAALVNP